MLKYFLISISTILTATGQSNEELIDRGYVLYSDFGAKGDGKTDDMPAIAAAHAYANEHLLPVRADTGFRYYISGKDLTAEIRTDTDFGSAYFVIDDRQVENRTASVFKVSSDQEVFELTGITSLQSGQQKIETKLPGPCLVTVVNDAVRHYIRFGLNQNNGSPQTDIFLVDKNGNVNKNTPIIWDFDHITQIKALPIDEKPLIIHGGHFITIANQEESKYNYFNRNFAINRSAVTIDGLVHTITGEGEHGAPYSGFLNISDCSDVTVQNSVFTGHKTYVTIGSAGEPVSMGSYDLLAGRALNLSFLNCTQTNDITDKTYWGILGSNYCKNMLYDNCILSRFDAHKGVANATIRNSTLGHMGINAIGSGTLLLENSTIKSNRLVNLRSDYGSTWQGEFIIRNCLFVPPAGSEKVNLIIGYNSGKHDFGYVCYMPEKITIENLMIDDSGAEGNYLGPAIFADFNPDFKDKDYREKFPYKKTKEVVLKNVITASGKSLRVSTNEVMFMKVKVREQSAD
jgi:hypothetical protein